MVLKMPQSFIEGALDQSREASIQGIMMRSQILQHLRSFIESGVGVTLPGINGVAPSVQAQFLHGLTEGTIGDPVVGPQFYHDPGLQSLDEKHPEGHML
jgi:hypothetical protein